MTKLRLYLTIHCLFLGVLLLRAFPGHSRAHPLSISLPRLMALIPTGKLKPSAIRSTWIFRP